MSPARPDHAAARIAAAGVKLLVLDVDGVLTDGGLWYDASGGVAKRFNIHDGLGLKLAQAAGLGLAVISGLDHPGVAARMAEMGLDDYHPGHLRKVPVLDGILRRRGLSLAETAFLGDDWLDAGPMLRVGLPMAVADAQPEIRDLALWVSDRKGGRGAVREAVRFILEARGDLAGQWRRWAS